MKEIDDPKYYALTKEDLKNYKNPYYEDEEYDENEEELMAIIDEEAREEREWEEAFWNSNDPYIVENREAYLRASSKND